MKLSAINLKDLQILKHYRIIRKWACKNNDLTDADLEVLIYLDCMDLLVNMILNKVFILIVGIIEDGID